MTEEKILETAVKALDSKKAEDICVIRISDKTIIGDYFVIANGTSSTHTKALADEVEYQLGEAGVKPKQVSGANGSNWIVLDYSDVIVHVFSKDMREFYNLERLWRDGENIDISKWVKPN